MAQQVQILAHVFVCHVCYAYQTTTIIQHQAINSHGEYPMAPLGMMHESNVEVDVITYNALMSCLGRTGLLMAAGAGKHFEDVV